MVGRALIRRTLGIAAGFLLSLLPFPAEAGNPADPATPLQPPSSAPESEAMGTVTARTRRGAIRWKAMTRGLEGREPHVLRLEGGADLVVTSARRSGRARFRFRSDRMLPGAPLPVDGKAVEVVRTRDGAIVLTGVLPGTDPGGGDDGGDGGDDGGESPTTRLPGVDGLGPWTVASETVSITAPAGGLAGNQSVLYYPTSGGGVLPEGETFPPVVIVHGFTARASNHAEIGATVASWGFVVLVGDHIDPLFPVDHEKQVKTTLGYVDWLAARDTDSDSNLFGRLRTDRFGLVGHSLGGGSAVVASTRAASGGRVKAVVAMAPAGLITGIFGNSILPDTSSGNWPATLVLTGTQDAVVAAGTSKTLYYDPAPAGRSYLRRDGWCHVGFAENIPVGDYNPATCVAPAVQASGLRLYAVPWLLFHLRDDLRVTDYVDGTVASEDPAVAER